MKLRADLTCGRKRGVFFLVFLSAPREDGDGDEDDADKDDD